MALKRLDHQVDGKGFQGRDESHRAHIRRLLHNSGLREEGALGTSCKRGMLPEF